MLSKKQFCIAILQDWCNQIGLPRDDWSTLTEEQIGNSNLIVEKAAYMLGITTICITCVRMYAYAPKPHDVSHDKYLTFDEIYTSLPDKVTN